MNNEQSRLTSSTDMRLGQLVNRSLEMRELKYFYHVAHTGNFGCAARQLNVTQSTLTKQIKKLEESFEVRLFIRHGRGVTLTSTGTRLLDRLEIIMPLLNAPLLEASSSEETVGTISLALPAECTPLLVPPLIAHYQPLRPRLNLVIREGSSASLEEWIIAGRVNVALLQDPPVLDELKIDPILTEQLGLVVAARSPLGDSIMPIRARVLVGLPMILPCPRHWIRRRVENAWFHRGIKLDLLQQIENVTVIKEMVHNDMGCSILPYATVCNEVNRGSLVFRPIEQMPLRTVHAIAWRKEVAAIPALPEFIHVLRDLMVELANKGKWPSVSVLPPAKKQII